MKEITAFTNLVRQTAQKVIPGARVSNTSKKGPEFLAESRWQVKITSQILDAILDENYVEIHVLSKINKQAGIFAYSSFDGVKLVNSSPVFVPCNIGLSLSDPEFSTKLEKLLRDAIALGYGAQIDDTNKWWSERTSAFTPR